MAAHVELAGLDGLARGGPFGVRVAIDFEDVVAPGRVGYNCGGWRR
jgi:hypothetical protein